MSILLVIDPGHGGQRPAGSSSPWGGRGPGGTLEKDVTLALARRIKARAGTSPRVELTRDVDCNLTLAQRADVARRLGAHAFISLHANHGPGAPRGSEVWIRSEAGTRSRTLGEALCSTLSQAGGSAVPRAGELAVLDPPRLGGTAGALVELDLLSSRDGEQRLVHDRSLDDIADRLLTAVRRWGQFTWAHSHQGGTYPPLQYPTQPPSSGGEAVPQQPTQGPVSRPAQACPANVYFAFDSDIIDETAWGPLFDDVARWLSPSPSEHVNIVGHTDPVGGPDYNRWLAQRRAEAVAQALLRRGVAASQLSVSSMGETAPVSGGNPAQHHLDRRAAIECTASYGP